MEITTEITIKKNVLFFYEDTDELGFCSNYYKSPIEIDGKVWPTTEHYFQAMKFPTNPEL